MADRTRLESLVRDIGQLPDDWHGCGTVPPAVLEAILKHTDGMKINDSVETGSGRTTLLFSHLSSHHIVFTLGQEGSSSKVQESSLLEGSTVEWVMGPSQKTLPKYEFKRPLQLAMIDGPHGYPFPDLEYYFLYPHLAPGALLIVDDIQIPTIDNLRRFLEVDEMFEPLGVASTTAFFRRTDTPTFDPMGDGWWIQNFNKQTLDSTPPRRGARAVFDQLPPFVKSPVRKLRSVLFGDPLSKQP